MHEAPRSEPDPTARPTAVAQRTDDELAQALRGFGPIGIVAIVVVSLGNALFVPAAGILVLLWAWRSRTPWSVIGYARPRSWVGEATPQRGGRAKKHFALTRAGLGSVHDTREALTALWAEVPELS